MNPQQQTAKPIIFERDRHKAKVRSPLYSRKDIAELLKVDVNRVNKLFSTEVVNPPQADCVTGGSKSHFCYKKADVLKWVDRLKLHNVKL
jgi:hypothetical protein